MKTKIYRTKKANGNFTIIDNFIAAYLQNMSASALGLYCTILSLPENWHGSIKGFAAIAQDGGDKIKSTLDELLQKKMIVRKSVRGTHGRFESYKYSVTQFSEQELDALKRKYKGRTLVSNNIFKDTTITNREKGLMVYMLMTSRTGKLTIDTIAANFTDSKKSIAAGLKILEAHGYIQRYKLRQGGRFTGIAYIVNELPCAATDKTEEIAYTSEEKRDSLPQNTSFETSSPSAQNPYTVKAAYTSEEKHDSLPQNTSFETSSPCAQNPYTVKAEETADCASPSAQKPSAVNPLAYKDNNKLTLSTGNLSIQLDSASNSKTPANDLDGLNAEKEREVFVQHTHQQPIPEQAQPKQNDFEQLKELTAQVSDQVHLDDLCSMYPDHQNELISAARLMVEIIHSSRTYGRSLSYRINGTNVPAQAVAFRFRQLDADQFDYVASVMSELTIKIRNPRAYMISLLYNAPTTYQIWLDSCVNSDLYGEEAQEYREQQERNAAIRRNSEQLSRLLAMTDEQDAS